MATVQVFLSAVSTEFRTYRDALRRVLDLPNVTVKVQEDFIATGTETLDKLDEYIRQCNAVIHLVGDMTGALAKATAVRAIGQRYPDLITRLPVLGPFLGPGAPALSYTQWEAWLALYHDKVLIIAVPQDGAPRDERYQLVKEQCAAQQAHLARLASVGRYAEIHFANADRLAVDVLRSKLQDIVGATGREDERSRAIFRSLVADLKNLEPALHSLGSLLDHTDQGYMYPDLLHMVEVAAEPVCNARKSVSELGDQSTRQELDDICNMVEMIKITGPHTAGVGGEFIARATKEVVKKLRERLLPRT